MEQLAEESPRPRARVTGVVYLLYFITAILAVLTAKGLVVAGDAAATAKNILMHEPLFRLSFALGLIANAFYIALTALFYELFKPVNRSLALLAVLFGLVGCSVQIFGGLFQLSPLVVPGSGDPYSGALSAEQSQVLALTFLKLHAQAFNAGLVFFALFCLLIGYLIVRSAFLPRILGMLLMLAGLGWLTYLWPPLADSLARYIQPFGFLAELVLMLWLLVRGVNVRR